MSRLLQPVAEQGTQLALATTSSTAERSPATPAGCSVPDLSLSVCLLCCPVQRASDQRVSVEPDAEQNVKLLRCVCVCAAAQINRLNNGLNSLGMRNSVALSSLRFRPITAVLSQSSREWGYLWVWDGEK